MNLVFLDPDKIKPSKTGIKIKLLILLAHIVFFGWVFSAEFSWQFLVFASPFLWFFISKMGMEIGFHRYFCHKSFKTDLIRERLLLILGTIASVGSSITWVATHRVHHKFADHDGDPQNPNKKARWKIWLTFFGNDWRAPASVIKDLVRDPWHRTIHMHYFKFVLLYVFVLAVISLAVNSWYPIIAAWAIPVVVNFNLAGFLNSLFHNRKFGYRNFETKDDSTNSAILNVFMAGAGMHNNHHAYPESYTYNVKNRWYEFDPTASFIKRFLATEINLPEGKTLKV